MTRAQEAEPPGRSSPAVAARRNMHQLIQLRWLAVGGQIVTILVADLLIGIRLPLAPMMAVPAVLVLVNLVSLPLLRRRVGVANAELFVALLLDVGALAVQLYLSGGSSNPFVSLFLLQVVMGAVLLDIWSAWAIVIVAALTFGFLSVRHLPLHVPAGAPGDYFSLYLQGSFICFALIAVLLVSFVTRIGRILRARDTYLADMRQQAAEEDHIVRMGLLASGAAHELGTPLASLSVILSDWRRMPALAADPELAQEIAEMQAEVQRCKAIVTGILLSAGEVRGEAPVQTTLKTFLDDIVAEWRASRGAGIAVHYRALAGEDLPIVADVALKQVIGNVLDNAADASPDRVAFSARREGDAILMEVRDAGPGFAPDMLAEIGRPYRSTKGRPGGGLGLFLVTNVMRKFGGSVRAENDPAGGAIVTLTLPLDAIAIVPEDGQGGAHG